MIVYNIRNKIKKKSYIGVTEFDFKTRYPQEKWWLYTHSHHLKSAVEKYGLENFEVQILWTGETTKEGLIELEKKYIDQYNSMIPNGYNLVYGGKNSDSPKNIKTYELVDFNGNKLKIRNLRAFCREKRLNYGGMLNIVSGKWPQSQGYALANSNLTKINDPNQSWLLQNIKTKEISEVKKRNVHKWAKEKGLDPNKIESVVSGKTKISQGWKLQTTTEESTDRAIKNVKLLSPEGVIVEIKNIYKFAKENNFSRHSFYSLIKGKALSAYGWRLPIEESEFYTIKEKRAGRYAILLSPSGEKVEIKNISAFCRKHNLSQGSIFCLLSGRTKISNSGWSLFKEDVNITKHD